MNLAAQRSKVYAAFVVLAITAAMAAVSLAASPASATVTWSSPATLSQLESPPRNAGSPQVVTSADGSRITAVWYREGDGTQIQAASSANGGASWSTPVNISEAGFNASSVQVTGSADGLRVTAVWRLADGPNHILQVANSSNGGTAWGSPITVSGTGHSIGSPQVASTADGTRVTAVWMSLDGQYSILAATSTDSGANWADPVQISTSGDSANASSPQVAYSADGTKLDALWTLASPSPSFSKVQWARRAGGAPWGAPTDLVTGAVTNSVSGPQLTSSTDGQKLAAIWSRTNDSSKTVIQSTSTGDGGANWTTPADLSQTDVSSRDPQLAASADGATLVATWSRANGNIYTVQARRSIDGGANWLGTTDLSDGTQSASQPQISASSDASIVTVVWNRSDGSKKIIQASTSTNAGLTWPVAGSAANLSVTGQDSNSQQVSGAASGSKVVSIWKRNADGTNGVIQASVLTFGYVSGGFTYNLNGNDTANVTGCDGSCPASLTIPSTLGGHPVASIADTAFSGQGLTSLVVPIGVSAVGDNAFSNNPALSTVRFLGDRPTFGAGSFGATGTSPLDARASAAGWANGEGVGSRSVRTVAAPLFTTQPKSTKIVGPGTVQLVAVANARPGGGTLSYQWFRGAQALTGRTTPTLVVSAAGSYSLRATTWAGTTSSATAVVTTERAAQTAKVSLPAILAKGTVYNLPPKTQQGQAMRWTVNTTGQCRINAKMTAFVCTKATGQAKAQFVGLADGNVYYKPLRTVVTRAVR